MTPISRRRWQPSWYVTVRWAASESRKLRDAQHVDYELGQLEGLARHGVDPGGERGVVVEQLGVEGTHHRRAGAGGDYDGFRVLEGVQEAPCQGPGVRPEARIEGRLATAGLVLRKVEVDSETPEDSDGALPDLRVELVDDAGDEEGCLQRRRPSRQLIRPRTTKPSIQAIMNAGPDANSMPSLWCWAGPLNFR